MKVNKLLITSALYAYHEFEKISLVGDKHGADMYKCKECGIRCKRPMLADYVNLVGVSAAKLYQCTNDEPFGIEYIAVADTTIAEGVEIVIIDPSVIPIRGINEGDVYKTVVEGIPEDFVVREGEVVVTKPYHAPNDKYVKLLSHEFKFRDNKV